MVTRGGVRSLHAAMLVSILGCMAGVLLSLRMIRLPDFATSGSAEGMRGG